MIAVPKLRAETNPVVDTVATAGLLEVQALLAAAVPEPTS